MLLLTALLSSLFAPVACSLGRVSNEAFCTAIAAWAFQQRGVLRASKLTHRVLAGAEPGAVRDAAVQARGWCLLPT